MSLLGLAGPAGASGGPGVAAATLANVVSVASAPTGGSVCAVLSTGHVDCWGDNQEGELGDGTTTNSDVPVAAAGITKAKTVIADQIGSFCALLSTGHVACWGEGTFGELGNGTITNSDVPVAVKTIGTASAVTGGQFGFCAVLSTGHVDCWGNGSSGALGNGTGSAYSDVPVAVSGISDAAAVTGGPDDFCALLSTGDVDCWGYNFDGELGDGTTTSSDVPVAVQAISNVTVVTADYEEGTFCAVLSTGDVDCWGSNSSGQLGDGNGTTNSDVPVATGVSAATTLAAGTEDFCAVLSTGHMTCWGYNGSGQLGNGYTGDYSDVPRAVKYIKTATAVTADVTEGRSNGFCAVLSTSHVDCWGSGSDGELGNGTTTNSDVPVAVLAAS